MKRIQIIMISLFFLILLVPLVTFNFEKNSISEIDNRLLAENPFAEEGDLTENIENYINDRLGLRDKMILSYTVLNDRIFHKMVHPSYEYGKDGYVFGAGLTTDVAYNEYHEAFADMVKEIQTYCEEREVPFLFVFDPAKPAVLTEYLPKGINYDRQWVEDFMTSLEERDVRYIDNTSLLRDKTEKGEVVYNMKYDANHWNDLGAYYGTNAMLRELQKDFPSIHINQEEELIMEEELMTSLPVSEFPIHEYVPKISFDAALNEDMTAVYNEELERNSSYTAFGYISNPDRLEENAPRVLVFQGSFMNNLGYKYLANGFGEYVYVHSYQNVMDFSYYFNIFQPECVIFEVAEYTFSDTYFDYEDMVSMELNPVLESVKDFPEQKRTLIPENVTIEQGEILTKICWQESDVSGCAWLSLDRDYDMKKTETGYEVTVLTENYLKYRDDLVITVWDGSSLFCYE